MIRRHRIAADTAAAGRPDGRDGARPEQHGQNGHGLGVGKLVPQAC